MQKHQISFDTNTTMNSYNLTQTNGLLQCFLNILKSHLGWLRNLQINFLNMCNFFFKVQTDQKKMTLFLIIQGLL